MTAAMNWEVDQEHEEFRASVRAFVDRQVRPVVEEPEEAGHPPAALPKTCTGKIMRRLPRDEAEHRGPRGDTSAMEDRAGLPAVRQAARQAVSAEAARRG